MDKKPNYSLFGDIAEEVSSGSRQSRADQEAAQGYLADIFSRSSNFEEEEEAVKLVAAMDPWPSSPLVQSAWRIKAMRLAREAWKESDSKGFMSPAGVVEKASQIARRQSEYCAHRAVEAENKQRDQDRLRQGWELAAERTKTTVAELQNCFQTPQQVLDLKNRQRAAFFMSLGISGVITYQAYKKECSGLVSLMCGVVSYFVAREVAPILLDHHSQIRHGMGIGSGVSRLM